MHRTSQRLLLVDPRGAFVTALQDALPGWRVERAPDLAQARAQLLGRRADVGLVAWDLGDERRGVDFVRDLTQRACSVPLLLAVGSPGEEELQASWDAEASRCLDLSASTGALAWAVRFAAHTRRSWDLHNDRQLAATGSFLAHEGKNALAGIRGALEVLAHREAADANRAVWDEVLQRLDALTGTVDSLAHLLHDVKPTRLPVPLRSILESLDPRGTYIEVSGDDLVLRGDANQLGRLFNAVVRNAVENAQPAGKVRVACARRDDMGAITVTDSGPPSTQSDLSVLLERFYTTKGNRPGLGLPIAKRIAEAHGGELQLAPGSGSLAVTVLLPLAPD